jgi:hypothetical protein
LIFVLLQLEKGKRGASWGVEEGGEGGLEGGDCLEGEREVEGLVGFEGEEVGVEGLY